MPAQTIGIAFAFPCKLDDPLCDMALGDVLAPDGRQGIPNVMQNIFEFSNGSAVKSCHPCLILGAAIERISC
jgi:hypothetical protein